MRGARVSLAAFALAAQASGPPHARAQTAAQPGAEALATIQYDAPASCPDRAEFLRRIQARTRTVRAPSAAATAPRLTVRIRVLAGRVLGTIAIEDSDGAVAGRQIRAASCDEASDALALIAALALDPDRRADSLGAEPGERTAEGADASASTGAGTAGAGQPGATGSGSGSGSGSASGSGSGSEAESESGPESESESEAESASEAEAESEAEALAGPAGVASQRFVLTASGLVLAGVLPDVAPGFAFAVVYAVEPHGLPELALRGGFALTPTASETHTDGVVEFGWWSALASLCSGLRDRADSASLWLCAAGEVGRLAASGHDTRDARSEDRSWAALGPAVLGQWEPLRPLVLQAGAGALFPLVRDRFLLADEVIHRASRPGVRVDLGVGLRIW